MLVTIGKFESDNEVVLCVLVSVLVEVEEVAVVDVVVVGLLFLRRLKLVEELGVLMLIQVPGF